MQLLGDLVTDREEGDVLEPVELYRSERDSRRQPLDVVERTALGGRELDGDRHDSFCL
jgi:hypothetical protein